MGGSAEERPNAEAVFNGAGNLERQLLVLDPIPALTGKSIQPLRIEAVSRRARFSAGSLLLHPALA